MHLEVAKVWDQRRVGRRYRLLTLCAPKIAPRVRPGQFVHVLPPLEDVTLRRPFSPCRVSGAKLSILYSQVGRGTAAMTQLRKGDRVSVVGPLGHGFPLQLECHRCPVLVAGGYGVGPLWLLASVLPRRGVVFIGGATADDILCAPDFRKLGWTVRITTEDGSRGTRGLVTAALDAWLRSRPAGSTPEFFACGPNAMLQAVGQRALRGGWRAWLSLDRHMGCGVGACLSCVQRVRREGVETWARVCREGPVFEAREIVWEATPRRARRTR